MTRPPAVTATALALALLAAGLIARRGDVRILRDGLPGIPLEIDGWKGRDDRFDDDVYKKVDADATLLRRYERPGGAVIWLYIGYYGTRKGGRTGHTPVYCYPGAGWDIEEKGTEAVPGPGGGDARVNRLLLRRGDVRTHVLYWMQSGDGRALNSGWRMNLHRFWRRALSNRDDGALVRLSGPVDEDGPAAALTLQKSFAAAVLKELPRHWPEERAE